MSPPRKPPSKQFAPIEEEGSEEGSLLSRSGTSQSRGRPAYQADALSLEAQRQAQQKLSPTHSSRSPNRRISIIDHVNAAQPHNGLGGGGGALGTSSTGMAGGSGGAPIMPAGGRRLSTVPVASHVGAAGGAAGSSQRRLSTKANVLPPIRRTSVSPTPPPTSGKPLMGGRRMSLAVTAASAAAQKKSHWATLRQKVQRNYFSHSKRLSGVDATLFEKQVALAWSALGPNTIGDESHQDYMQTWDDPLDEDFASLAYAWDRYQDGNLYSTLQELAQNMVLLVMDGQTNTLSLQETFQKAWHLLILALHQEDSVARFTAMSAVLLAFPCIRTSLLDMKLREYLVHSLVDIMHMESMRELRLKAIFLLGEAATHLDGSESAAILQVVSHFRTLTAAVVKLIPSLGTSVSSVDGKAQKSMLELKIYLLQAVGRYLSQSVALQEKANLLMTYMLYDELTNGHDSEDVYLMRTILDLLVNQFEIVPQNARVIGAIFKPLVEQVMRNYATDEEIQTLAVHFYHRWLPIASQDCLLDGVRFLLKGLSLAADYGHTNKNSEKHAVAKKNLLSKLHEEEALLGLRGQFLRELVAVPGTFTILQPVKNRPGYFADPYCALFHTKEVVINLPIEPTSRVTITRPIPRITGVPNGATTVPPLFFDISLAHPKETDEYPLYERYGLFPGLPAGYSYSPTRFVKTGTRKWDGAQLVGENPSPADSVETNAHWIPAGTERAPPKYEKLDPKAAPYPFFTKPVNAQDAEKVDKTQKPSVKSLAFEAYESEKLPAGTSFAHTPVIIPSDNPALQTVDSCDDFMLNAPVVFSIFDPIAGKLIRILTRVRNTNFELNSVAVDGEIGTEPSRLLVGATFNIFVKNRYDPHIWRSVHLEITDMDYNDDFPMDLRNQSATSTMAIPAGFSNSIPFFAPPVNFPPVPAGYSAQGIPYYGRTPNPKPIPLGMTCAGIRFYKPKEPVAVNSLTEITNSFVGFDAHGYPIFSQKGYIVPTAAGYTTDGVPYYDFMSLLRSRGSLYYPRWAGFASICADIVPLLSGDKSNHSLGRNDPLTFWKQTAIDPIPDGSIDILITELERDVERKFNCFLGVPKPITKQLCPCLSSIGTGGFDYEAHKMYEIPETPITFLKTQLMERFSQQTAGKFTWEPASLEFDSVRKTMAKPILLKHRFPRLERESRQFIVCSDRPKVFMLEQHFLQLGGEGVTEVVVNYRPPPGSTSEKEEGTISLLDAFGCLVSSCKLTARHQDYIQVSPMMADLGWVLPGSRKTTVVRVENVNSTGLSVEFRLGEDNPDVLESARPISPFTISTRGFRLHAGETKYLTVTFEPIRLGAYREVLQILTPIGDITHIPFSACTGVPFGFVGEPEYDPKVSIDAIGRERGDLMEKLSKMERGHQVELSEDEQRISDMIMWNKFDDCKQQQKVDLGIVDFGDSTVYRRMLTIFNLTDSTVSLGLHPKTTALRCTNFLRMPPKKCNTILLELDKTELGETGGIVEMCIEVSCVSFQTTDLYISAYIGMPIFAPSTEVAFMKPCRVGGIETLKTFLVNTSPYPLEFTICRVPSDKYMLPQGTGAGALTFSVSMDEEKPTTLEPYSVLPVEIVFRPTRRGPFAAQFNLKNLKPITRNWSLCAGGGGDLTVVGVGLDPKYAKADDPNGLDLIQAWISNPRMILEKFPTDLSVFKAAPLPDLRAATGTIIRADTINARPNPLAAIVSSTEDGNTKSVFQVPLYNSGVDIEGLRFMYAGNISMELARKDMVAGRVESVPACYLPQPQFPSMSSAHGFVAVIDERTHAFNAAQVVGKHQILDLLIFPAEDPITKKRNVDFGSIDKSRFSSGVAPIVTQKLLLCNSSATNIGWDIRLNRSTNAALSFEATVTNGELEPGKCAIIPVNFKAENIGVFEVVADIFAKDMLDKFGKAVRQGKITFRAKCVETTVTGMPESVDFGNVVIKHPCTKTFVIKNTGVYPCKIRVVSKPPVSASPTICVLEGGKPQEIAVEYSPKSNGILSTSLSIYVNHQLFSITLTGAAGGSTLVCASAPTNVLHLGRQPEHSLIWTDLYLCNKGTLPLNLAAAVCDMPEAVAVEFIGEMAGSDGRNTVNQVVSRDFWAIVKSKLSTVIQLKTINYRAQKFLRGSTSLANSLSGGVRLIHGKPLSLFSSRTDFWSEKNLVGVLPTLDPSNSLQFRVAFRGSARLNSAVPLTFHYLPVVPISNKEDMKSYGQSLKIDITVDIYRRPEFFPLFYDYGVVPLYDLMEKNSRDEVTIGEKSLGISRHSTLFTNNDTVQLTVTNPNLEMLYLRLERLTPGWIIEDNFWKLSAGEKLQISILFRPIQRQALLHGKAIFRHKYGTTTISLSGTGSKADVITNLAALDFGNIQIRTTATKPIMLINQGLLPTCFQAFIEPSTSEFYFADDETSFVEGVVESASSLQLNVGCTCSQPESTPTNLTIRWQPVPRGSWEERVVPMYVAVGNPAFRLRSNECDFQITFIGTSRASVLEVYNDGNASCKWSTSITSEWVKVEPAQGVLEAGSQISVKVTYAPVKFELFRSRLVFHTDIGDKSVICYGVVGIPNLKVKEEDLNANFGVIQIEKRLTKVIPLANMSKRVVQYEINLSNITVNGEPVPEENFGDIVVERREGAIPPGETVEALLHVMLSEFKADYRVQILVVTRDGERYAGIITATGGQAILQFSQPPQREGAGILVPQPAPTLLPVARLNVIDLSLESLAASIRQAIGLLQTAQKNLTTTEPGVDHSFEHARAPKSFIIKNESDLLPSLSTADLDMDKSLEKELSRLLVDLASLGALVEQGINAVKNAIEETATDVIANLRVEVLMRLKEICGSVEAMKTFDIMLTAFRVFTEELTALENALDPEAHKLDKDYNKNRLHRNFYLGLLCGGIDSAQYDLVEITNSGNLDCEFTIRPREDISVQPTDFVQSEAEPMFDMRPMQGILQPGSSAVVKTNFLAEMDGFYKQGYFLYAGDKPAVSFTTSANVGNPRIVASESILDFGIIQRNYRSTLILEIRNAGTFPDKIAVAPVPTEDNTGAEYFTMGDYKQLLGPSESTQVSFTFAPKVDGPFTRVYKVFWSKNPIIVTLTGSGGSAKIKPVLASEDEQARKGLDFGICLVDDTFERTFKVINEGEFEGRFSMTHPNENISIAIEGQNAGELALAPGKSINVRVIYNPKKKERLVEPISISIEENPSMIVTMTGFAGFCVFELDGVVNFVNMMMGDKQVMKLELRNTGDLKFPIEFALEPKELLEAMTFKSKYVEPVMLPGSNPIPIEVIAAPMERGKVQGMFIFRTNLGRGPVIRQYPIDFFVYKDPVILSEDTSVEMGRISAGDSEAIQRTLTNFAAVPYRYRFRKEVFQFPPDPSEYAVHSPDNSTRNTPNEAPRSKTPKRPKTAKLAENAEMFDISPVEGVIQPSDTVPTKFVFLALNALGDEWMQAEIVFEVTPQGQTTWKPVHNFSLRAGVGRAKMLIVPDSVDFEIIPIKTERTVTIVVQNEGNATLQYDLVQEYPRADIYRLEIPEGHEKISPGNKKKIYLHFSPKYEGLSDTRILLKAKLETKDIIVKGIGADYQIAEERLPKSIDFGNIEVGGRNQRMISLANNCRYVNTIGIKVDADENNDPNFFSVIASEMSVVLPANSDSQDSEHVNVEVTCYFTPPIDDDDAVDCARLSALVDRPYNTNLQISLPSAKIITIPISAKPLIIPFKMIMKPKDPKEKEEPLGDKFAFGVVNSLIGKSIPIIISNPNLIRMQYRMTLTNDFFAVSKTVGYLDAGASLECEVQLKSIDITDENDETPPTVERRGTLTFDSMVSSKLTRVFALEGTLKEASELAVKESFEFGDVFTGGSMERKFEIINPLRRKIHYSATVDKEFADIFRLTTGASGDIGFRKTGVIVAKFLPTSNTIFKCNMTIVTDAGTFQVECRGKGVKPSLRVEETVDFGMICLRQGSIFKTITLRNTCERSFMAKIDCSGSSFTPEVSEISLEAGQSKEVKVYFSPRVANAPYEGQLKYTTVVSPVGPPFLLAKTMLKGVGGRFEVNVGGFGKENVWKVKKLGVRRSVSRPLLVENKGDTSVSFELVDQDGNVVAENVPRQTSAFSYSVSNTSLTLASKTSQALTFTVNAGDIPGEENLKFTLRTKNFADPATYDVFMYIAVIEGGLLNGLRNLTTVDLSIEPKINMDVMEDASFYPDEHLWKLLRPVVRVAGLKPSEELQHVPVMEPYIPDANMEFRRCLARPPATLKEEGTEYDVDVVSAPVKRGHSRNARSAMTSAKKRIVARMEAAKEFAKSVERTLQDPGK